MEAAILALAYVAAVAALTAFLLFSNGPDRRD
jgi:hypothetical protein